MKQIILLFLIVGFTFQACRDDKGITMLQQGFNSATSSDQRLSFLRQMSIPITDVLVVAAQKEAIQAIWLDSLLLHGYDYTLIPDISEAPLRVKQQKIEFYDQIYRLIIVGDNTNLKRTHDLAMNGAVVLISEPLNVDGVYDLNDFRKIKYGGGGMVSNAFPHRILNMMMAKPQFYTTGLKSLNWKHYRFNSIEFFIVENASDEDHISHTSFGTLAGAPEIWDPENGKRYATEDYYQEKGMVKFNIALRPHQTLVYVFGTNRDRDQMNVYRL